MFQENIDFHYFELKKETEQTKSHDTRWLATHFPNMWTVLTDKGYNGAAEICWEIIIKKTPRNWNLSRIDENRNLTISSDQITV